MGKKREEPMAILTAFLEWKNICIGTHTTMQVKCVPCWKSCMVGSRERGGTLPALGCYQNQQRTCQTNGLELCPNQYRNHTGNEELHTVRQGQTTIDTLCPQNQGEPQNHTETKCDGEGTKENPPIHSQGFPKTPRPEK